MNALFAGDSDIVPFWKSLLLPRRSQKASNSSNFVDGTRDVDLTTLINSGHERHSKLWLTIILRSAVIAFCILISRMASGEEDDAITTLRMCCD